MKSFTYTSIEDRIEDAKKTFERKIENHHKLQKKIDFIKNLPWLVSHEEAEVSCHVYTLISNSISINISNVDIAEFMEGVLGPYHLEYGVKWYMELSGDVDDPVFTFKDSSYWVQEIQFIVKEGSFKQCTFVDKVVSFTEPIESKPVHELQMVCE